MKPKVHYFPDSQEGNGMTGSTPPAKPSTPAPVTSNAHMLRVEVPKAPPQEVLGMKFDVEQLPFMDEAEGGPVTTAPVVTVTEKPGVTQQEKVELAPIVTPTEKKDETDPAKKEAEHQISKHLKAPNTDASKEKPVVTGKEVTEKIVPKPGTFDYAGYSPEEINHLKNMNNQAREYTAKLIKESRDLAQLKSSSYLQHPEAYLLDPQFKSAQTDVSFAYKEAKFWEQQLVNCKQGKPVQELTAWDAQGNPVIGKTIEKPTDGIEEEIRMRMQNAVAAGNNIRTQLQQYPQRYQAAIQNDLKAINSERNARFGWVSDPKLQDYTINVEGLGDRSIKQIRNDIINLFPPYLRSNPAVEVCGDLMVALRIQSAELSEARANQHVAATNAKHAAMGEISSEVKPGNELQPVVGQVRDFKLDGFEV